MLDQYSVSEKKLNEEQVPDKKKCPFLVVLVIDNIDARVQIVGPLDMSHSNLV